MGEIKRDTLAVVVRCHVNVAEFVWSGFVCRDRDQFAWNAQRRKKARAVHREPIAVLNSDAGFLSSAPAFSPMSFMVDFSLCSCENFRKSSNC